MTPNLKPKGRERITKANENRPRKISENTVARIENKDVKKKEKNDGKRARDPEVPKKKQAGDAKAEPKTIPKRKKSERSNSDNEIKPKKMVAKEHPALHAKAEEPHEKTVARQARGRTPEKVPPHAKEPRRIPPAPKLSHLRPQQLRKETAKCAGKLPRDVVSRKEPDKEEGKKKQDAGTAVVLAKEEKKKGEESIVANTGDEQKEDDDELEEDESIEGEYTLKDDDTTVIDDALSSEPVEGDTGTDVSGGDFDMSSAEGAAKGGQEGDKGGEAPAVNCPPREGESEALQRDDCALEEDRRSAVDMNDSSLSESLFTIEDSDRSGAFKDDCSTKYFSTVDDDLSMKEVSIDEDHSLDIAMSDDQSMKDDLDDQGMRDDIFDDLMMKDYLLDEHGMKESLMDDFAEKTGPADDPRGKHLAVDDPGIKDGASPDQEMKDSASVDQEMKETPPDDHGMKEVDPAEEQGIHEDQAMREESAMGEESPLKEAAENGNAPESLIVTDKEELISDKKEDTEAKENAPVNEDESRQPMEGDKDGNTENEKMEENAVAEKEPDQTPVLPQEVASEINEKNDGEAVKEDAKIEEEQGTTTKEEETKVTERRSKRKMETERARGGTKKPARVFVDKGSTASGGGSRGSRESRVLTSARASTTTAEKKRQEAAPPPRRPRLDNIKSTIPKPGRLPPRKVTDPVKAARPGGPTSGPRGPHVGHGGSGPGQQHPVPHAEQLRRLEAEVAARAAEVKAARAERDQAGRGVEALSVIIHHLTHTYEPFSTPRLKAEVVRLTAQLTEARLNLDESTAAVRRLQEAAEKSASEHEQKAQQLEQKHRQTLEQINKQHQHELDLVLEKQRKDMAKFAEEQQAQREDLSRAHSAELEQMEAEWRSKLDVQHEKHLCAVQELNTRHTQKLRELESSRRARESELEMANERLLQEQEALKLQSKKLEETLLNDTDHRLLALRKMCSSLKSEVESLKTVVEMRNAEIHELRGQVVEMDRLTNDLELAREKSKALQAKTEDLQAQMEKRSMSERHLVNEHRLLIETYQRESNINKRLSLENEELAWKLRQREEIMSTSMPSSTLDLVSRSPASARRQEGASSPQAAPRSPRVAGRTPSGKVSPSKSEASKRRSRLGLSPDDGMNGDSRVQEVSLESPPPSPCVKAVVEKSNSVSFILDLNDSQSDDSFLDLPPSPRPRPHRTASLSAADRPRTPTQARRVMHNNRTNSLNKNGLHMDGKSKNINGKPKDFFGKARGMNGKVGEINGKSLDSNGHSSQPESGRSASESSEGGSEVERVSPTGLAWTVPVHKPKSPTKGHASRQNGSPVRGRIEHHLLEDPEEDEYEETPTHQFIEVVELSGVGLTSSSEAASDSELSQCDLIKGGSSTDSDSDSSEGEHHNKKDATSHQTLGHKGGPWCPKEGAGEAMITDELLKQYTSDPLSMEPKPVQGKRPLRRRIPSAPSSDSDDNNMNTHNNGTTGDVSWSEDVDITSSSEMHEL